VPARAAAAGVWSGKVQSASLPSHAQQFAASSSALDGSLGEHASLRQCRRDHWRMLMIATAVAILVAVALGGFSWRFFHIKRAATLEAGRAEMVADVEAGSEWGRATGVAHQRARTHGLGPDQGPRARAAGATVNLGVY
jgi:hypothetical protein